MRKNIVLLYITIDALPIAVDLDEVCAIQLRADGYVVVHLKSTSVFQCKLTQPGDTAEYTAEEYFTMYKSLVHMWKETYPVQYEIGDSLVEYSDRLFSHLVNAGEATHTVTIDRDDYAALCSIAQLHES